MKKKDKLYTHYMDYVLRKHKEPKSVYHFCKKIDIEEKKFYKHFKDLEDLKNSIFKRFHEHTLMLLHENKGFQSASSEDQLLMYYYTFFEILLANRSYVVYASRQMSPKTMSQLKPLRKEFKHFIGDLETRTTMIPNEKMAKAQSKFINETMWAQLLMILKFWLQDDSKSFEKTDVLIEKSVRATYDLFRIEPKQSVIDLGKFIIKEVFGDRDMNSMMMGKFKCSKTSCQ